jgi:MFS transporter, ACS family, hexuronate transporter
MAEAGQGWPKIRYWVGGLLFLSTVINYIDRQTLSVLAPVLTKEFDLSPVEYSNILTAFLTAYTVMYVGSGFLTDRWGTRKALSIFMGWWSLANMAHAMARGPLSLGALRFLLGAGESGNFMAAFKAISEWYPARERAFINGLVNAGAAVGAVIAPPLITWMWQRYGWQTAFVATGALGFVWLAAWLAIYHAPEHHPRITEEERALLAAEPVVAAAASGMRWQELLRYPQTWGLLAARFLSDPVWWFYLFWLPKYMVEHRGFTMLEMVMLAWMPYLAADAGSLFGGWVSGRLVARGGEAVGSRIRCMLPFAMVMPVSMLVNVVESRSVALGLICLVTFAHMGWKTNQATLTNDIYPKPLVGTVSGMLAFGNGLGGTLFTWMTGYVVQYFGYGAIFAVMGVMHPLAYLTVRRLVRGPLGQ